jgi:2-C-methyl-D-erythritol 4-phosphate cytidylyltransferase
MLDWSIAAFDQHPGVDVIVVVAPRSNVDTMRAIAAGRATVVPGGATRQESVGCGLQALPAEVDVVLVHDAARPLIIADLIGSVISAVRSGAEAVIPVLEVSDTIKRVDKSGRVLDTVDRTQLRRVQTPQGFRRDVLRAAHRSAQDRGRSDVTDDAGLVEAIGRIVSTVPGSEFAFKVTTAHDLAQAQRWVDGGVASMQPTVGSPAIGADNGGSR